MFDSMPLKARPTTYKGTRMRSRLEAGFAAWLDSEHISWEYEPECFGSDEGQYLPDFRLTGIWVDGRGTGSAVYVECKAPTLDFEVDVFSFMRRMEVIRASDPAAVLAIASPHDLAFWSFPLSIGQRWGVGVWRRCAGDDEDCGRFSLSPVNEVYDECPCCWSKNSPILSPWVGKPYWKTA